ncbi:MAG: hypothetical protein HYS17_08640 [Micavibrio aeruginosavorus]|uniref:Uncharacterized protein n=1 Tax=Micavibrio aeruginosavorus TaxID=349221 RepID=A0A7T5R143_9BACT|nr:MAG: hypothetical protein HYS17_08640 [Micavibrio aeruginosavorus]
MEYLLIAHEHWKPWIDLAQDTVFSLGVIPFFIALFKFIKFLKARDFLTTTEKIESNLRFREYLEPKLESYVLEKYKNGIKDIGVRFIYWKNYPSQISNDAYKHLLRIEYHDQHILGASWINNTGIYFQEHLWFSNTSVYVDRDGVFFFAPSGGAYKHFTEHKNRCLVIHLPFTNVVNFDFEEKIEYEPIFYIKVPYYNFKDLYSDICFLRERTGDQYFSLELDFRKQIKEYSWLRYMMTYAKILFLRFKE